MNLPQAHAAVLGRMAEAVRQGTAPLVTGSEACAGLTLIEAMLTSAAEGGRHVSLRTPG
jgi:predicted dehydrogenase